MGLKIFTRILASRLAPEIPAVIHYDQVGFVSTREVKDSVKRVLDLLHVAKTRSLPLMLLSTDTEKAFDWVCWAFMETVLHSIGIGDKMQTWLNTLYSCPSAQLKVNGLLSSPFSIRNGTRQGC